MARRPRAATRGNVGNNSGVDGTVDGDGKPNGDGAGGSTGSGGTVDPASIGGPATGDGDNGGSETEQPREKRKYRTRGKTAPLDLGDFADILLVAHAGFASALNAPNINLTDDEAARLAKAAQNVARHYNFPGMAAETKDWISLVVAMGSIYGPRVTAAFVNRNAKSEEPKEPATIDQSATVMPFRQGA